MAKGIKFDLLHVTPVSLLPFPVNLTLSSQMKLERPKKHLIKKDRSWSLVLLAVT